MSDSVKHKPEPEEETMSSVGAEIIRRTLGQYRGESGISNAMLAEIIVSALEATGLRVDWKATPDVR